MNGSQKSGFVVSLSDRGYGFLAVEGERDNIFFHCRQLAPGLPFDETLKGRRLRFSTEPDPRDSRRSRAVRIEPAD